MKKLILVAGFGILLGSASLNAAEYRNFTSADGSKTIRAKVTNVTTAKDGSKIAVIQKENGKRYKFPATALSAEDQKHIDKVAGVMAAGRYVAISVKENIERGKTVVASQRKKSTDKHSFDIKLRNNGKDSVEGLEVNYKIFYSIEERETKRRRTKNVRVLKTEKGNAKLTSLAARGDIIQTSDSVGITKDLANPG